MEETRSRRTGRRERIESTTKFVNSLLFMERIYLFKPAFAVSQSFAKPAAS